MEDNFEKILKSKFEKYQKAPPPDLWDKVATSVFDEAPKNYLVAARNLLWVFLISLGASFTILNWQANKSVNESFSLQKINNSTTENYKTIEKPLVNPLIDSTNVIASVQVENKQQQSQSIEQFSSTTPNLQSQSNQTIAKNTYIRDKNSMQKEDEITQKNNIQQVTTSSFDNINPNTEIYSANNKIAFSSSLKTTKNDINKLPLLGFKGNNHQNRKTVLSSPFDFEFKKHELLENIRFFVGFYVGPSLSYRVFRSNHNLMGRHKNEYERAATTYDVGIEAGYKFGYNWEVSIGLSVDNFTESYDFSGVKIIHDTNYVYNTDQLTGQMVTTVEIEELHHQVGHSTKNNYQFLSLPIMLGYKLSISERFLLIPSLGLNVDILTKAQASWLHPETLEPMVMRVQNGQFNSVLLASSAQFSIQYEYSKRWTMFFRPRFRMIHQSIFKQSDLLDHRPYSFDFNFGLRRYLSL